MEREPLKCQEGQIQHLMELDARDEAIDQGDTVSLETRGITESKGTEVSTSVCTLEVALLCVRSVNLGAFCSGGWKLTTLVWRANYCVVAAQKTCQLLSTAGPQCQWHTSRCFQSHLNREPVIWTEVR